MRLDSQDYKKLVTGTYKKMRSDNELSPLLAKPTRANIRKECLHVCKERYRKEDARILRAFFGPADSQKEFMEVIFGCPADKFRPVCNYLNGETENTDHVNLELLGWLIDFRHRPFSHGMNVDLNDEELAILEGRTLPPQPPPLPPFPPINPPAKERKKRKRGVIFLILAIFTGSAFIIWQQNKPTQQRMATGLPAAKLFTEDRQLPRKQKTDSLVEQANVNPVKPNSTNKLKTASPSIVQEADRCHAITKKGTQCKRKAKSNYYCLQHVRMIAFSGTKQFFKNQFYIMPVSQ